MTRCYRVQIESANSLDPDCIAANGAAQYCYFTELNLITCTCQPNRYLTGTHRILSKCFCRFRTLQNVWILVRRREAARLETILIFDYVAYHS